ncbi:MAG TPA: ribonuclease HII [Bacilli bacterium]|nr:ribonuclease HII [Bacilli bacterium]HQC74311.1 ribonuclease HII [Bacilli bacterium]
MDYNLYIYEHQLQLEGYQGIVGIDEVGRGPMAGPLVACAVMLPHDYYLAGLDDSKKMSAKQREKLYTQLINEAIEYHYHFISVADVDRLNVYQASRLAMLKCLAAFKNPVDAVLTDAMPLEVPYFCLDLIKGDQKSASIAAASIMAKVIRDRYMEEMDLIYPQYGFKKHKGYVTKQHLLMLEQYGPCALHRQSFQPVKTALEKKQDDFCFQNQRK